MIYLGIYLSFDISAFIFLQKYSKCFKYPQQHVKHVKNCHSRTWWLLPLPFMSWAPCGPSVTEVRLVSLASTCPMASGGHNHNQVGLTRSSIKIKPTSKDLLRWHLNCLPVIIKWAWSSGWSVLSQSRQGNADRPLMNMITPERSRFVFFIRDRSISIDIFLPQKWPFFKGFNAWQPFFWGFFWWLFLRDFSDELLLNTGRRESGTP